MCERENVLFMCLSLSLVLTGTISRRQRGFPDRRQGAAVLLNLVHAHRTIPHCVFMVVDRRRAANSSSGVLKTRVLRGIIRRQPANYFSARKEGDILEGVTVKCFLFVLFLH